MTDDREGKAREQGQVIEKALKGSRLKMVSLVEEFINSGSTNLNEIDKLRRVIEALE